jgi:hypothetical protein
VLPVDGGFVIGDRPQEGAARRRRKIAGQRMATQINSNLTRGMKMTQTETTLRTDDLAARAHIAAIAADPERARIEITRLRAQLERQAMTIRECLIEIDALQRAGQGLAALVDEAA